MGPRSIVPGQQFAGCGFWVWAGTGSAVTCFPVRTLSTGRRHARSPAGSSSHGASQAGRDGDWNFAPRSSKPVTTDDSGAVLALGTGPGTTNALPPGISGDPIDGLVLQGGTGSAQAALFVTSTSDFAASLSPSTVAAGQITPGLQLRLVPLASSARIDSTSRPVEIVPAHLPAPRGADLITNSGLFRNWQFDGRLSRLFGDPREPFEPQSHGDSYLSWVALALVAFEAARRWRRRSTKKPRISQRFRHSLINGLHWNSP